MMANIAYSHEESWLLLPWLANGRLSGTERAQVEEHLRGCAACAQEIEAQRRLCEALNEPERVTHAPGPSFRKLMERIDGRAGSLPARERAPLPARAMVGRVASAAWRPPGLAWAASFVLTITLGVAAATAYLWMQPRYVTYTDPGIERSAPNVLHIAFQRSLPIDDVAELLRAAGAHVVEGPGTTGIFGVAPVMTAADPAETATEMRALAARLRADPRVRWVQPLAQPAESAHGPRMPQR